MICVGDFRNAPLPLYAAPMVQSLAEKIRLIRNNLGLKQDEFAEALGTTQGTVSRWERGAKPEFDYLQAIANLGKTSVDQLLSGAVSDNPKTFSVDGGEAVEIIQLDLSLPMGPGATIEDYIEEEPRLFDLAYIRGFTRTPPHRLRLARGVGDSMYPTLISSDQVWIDSTQTMLNQQDRVWAVSINGAAAIKRLRSLKGGRVEIVSDNPAIGNYEVDADEIMIGGRVIRFTRDL